VLQYIEEIRREDTAGPRPFSSTHKARDHRRSPPDFGVWVDLFFGSYRGPDPHPFVSILSIARTSALVSESQEGFLLLIYSRSLSVLSNRAGTDTTFRLATLALRAFYPAIKLAPPLARLSVISRHLDPRPSVPINTAFSIEKISSNASTQSRSFSSDKPKMSGQPNHPTLLIPGPIEFDDAVLQSMSHHRYERLHYHPLHLSYVYG